jgi:hypothetical protein
MTASTRIRCLFGGHSWEQHQDPVGPLTFCLRCGKLRHARPSGNSPEQPQGPGVGGGGAADNAGPSGQN